MANKNYGWIWYFAIVLALSILAMVVVGWYNFALQLKPETLERAQALWKEKGPKDCCSTYTFSIRNPGWVKGTALPRQSEKRHAVRGPFRRNRGAAGAT